MWNLTCFRCVFSSQTALARCIVSSAEVRHFVSSRTTLETLQWHNSWTPLPGGAQFAAALENSSTLRTLVMPSPHPITEEAACHFAQLSTLQELDVSEHPVGGP